MQRAVTNWMEGAAASAETTSRKRSRKTRFAFQRGTFKEAEMRSLLLTATTGASLGLLILTISPANSITIASRTGVRQTADALDISTAVHCRTYAHQHKHGHRWGRGCRVTARGSSGIVLPTPLPAPTLPPIPRGPSGNYFNPNNPQDRSGNLNPQDMTQPRAFNPQDMR
jgi:hypothetical protein